MAYIDIPLSKFIGGGDELIERLYALPEESIEDAVRDDFELIMNLPTVEGYNPTRDHKPSVIWDKKFEPIFGCDNVCIYDPYYLLYIQIVNYICEKFEEDGEFKYTLVEDDEIVGCFELNNKNSVEEFLAHIVKTVHCTLYDLKNNINLC